jgi:hypothetical protein
MFSNLNLHQHQNHGKTVGWAPLPVSDLVRLEWDLRRCISDTFPGDTDGVGEGTKLMGFH